MLKAINISAHDAGEIEELPNDTVLISINNPANGVVDLKLDRNSSKILTIFFDDVTDSKVVYGRSFNPIDDETTLKILDFIERNKNKNFIIHCQAGISRSAAVALFINRFYGHELKPKFYNVSHPNYFVLGRLTFTREYGDNIGKSAFDKIKESYNI